MKLYVGYLRRKLGPDAPDDGADRDGARLRLPLPAERRLNALAQRPAGLNGFVT